MYLALTAFVSLSYAVAFVVAFFLPLRPVPVTAAGLIAALMVAYPLVINYHYKASGDCAYFDVTLGLLILKLACMGLFAGISTRCLLWWRGDSHTNQLPRTAFVLTGFMLLPAIFVAIV